MDPSDRTPAAPPPRATVCRAPGRCPGLWCRLMRRCFQEGAAAQDG
ncbi:MAG: hypothetical protein AB7K86_02615 [Rhodospirillales bacterium]